MSTDFKNKQNIWITVLIAIVVALVGYITYNKHQVDPRTDTVIPTPAPTAASEPATTMEFTDNGDAVIVEDKTVGDNSIEQKKGPPLLNGNVLQGSGNGEIYPELSFPDYTAPGYKKFTDAQLLKQIDSEYHEGLDMTDDPTAYGLNRLNGAPSSIHQISGFANKNLTGFVNQAFGRPNLSDVAIAMEGWTDLGNNEYVYRAVITSARYQCTWFQAVVNDVTGKIEYEEFIPCYQPGQTA